MKTLIILFSLIFSSLCLAIPEQDLKQNWDANVLPYFNSMTKGKMQNAQGMTVHYWLRVKKSNTKTLVIAPGRTEPSVKYAEVIYDLKNSDTNIFIIDFQGQGKSGRLLKDTHKSHVVNFCDYVQEFEQFINEVVVPNSDAPMYLLAHSMGAAVSVKYMDKNPNTFTKIVLSAPMMQINTKPYSEIIGRYFAKLLVATGKGSNYAPDQGPYKADQDLFETNIFTKSEARFNVSKHIFVTWPELTSWGPTARWVHEALKATKKINQVSIAAPILLLQAGKDQIVKPARQNSFCQNNNCTVKFFPESEHEILMERDFIRDVAMQEITLFLGL